MMIPTLRTLETLQVREDNYKYYSNIHELSNERVMSPVATLDRPYKVESDTVIGSAT